MAKLSMIERERKRRRLTSGYKSKREALKAIIQNPHSALDERLQASVKLQRLPRDSSPVRLHNRCPMTGRAHGYYRKFGLARNRLRQAAMQGDVPGLVKASW